MFPNEAFSWFVPTNGFHWLEGDDEPDPVLVPRPVEASKLQDSRTLPAVEYVPLKYDPLEDYSGLFKTFSELPLTKEAILKFADKYGSLTEDNARLVSGARASGMTVSMAQGERYMWWRGQIAAMRQAVMLWDLVQKHDDDARAGLARHIRWEPDEAGIVALWFVSHRELSPWELDNRAAEDPAYVHEEIASKDRYPDLYLQFKTYDVLGPAQLRIKQEVEKHLHERLSSRMIFTPGEAGMQWEVVPADLLSAMWLQFARSIHKGSKYRRCEMCDVWFELAPEIARTSRLFCSAACKSRDYRAKQDRARQLYAAKKTFQQIAKELGSDVKAVKRWITGRKG
jgi:hypothetical protein